MPIHLLTDSVSCEKSAFLCLAAGAATLMPAALSGWTAWRGRYHGARAYVFLKKLRIAYVIIPLGIALVMWRLLFKTTIHTTWHYIYSAGIVLLFFGVVLEGVHGGRLSHLGRKAPYSSEKKHR